MVRELWGYGSETEKNIGSGKHRRMSTLFIYIYIYSTYCFVESGGGCEKLKKTPHVHCVHMMIVLSCMVKTGGKFRT